MEQIIILLAVFAAVVFGGYYFLTRPRSTPRDDNSYERWCNQWVPGAANIVMVGLLLGALPALLVATMP